MYDSGKPVRIKADGTEGIFEGTGPGPGECSILVGPRFERIRKMVKLEDIELISEAVPDAPKAKAKK